MDQKNALVSQNHSFFGQMPKSSSKMMFSLHGDLYCYVKYSNVTYQDEIFINLLLNVMLKSKWLDMVLDVNFMTLTIWNLIFFFIFLEFTI